MSNLRLFRPKTQQITNEPSRILNSKPVLNNKQEVQRMMPTPSTTGIINVRDKVSIVQPVQPALPTSSTTKKPNVRDRLTIVQQDQIILALRMQEQAKILKIEKQQEGESPLMELLINMPQINYKPKEKIVRMSKTGKCRYMTKLGHNSWSARTISWCMLRPDAATCENKLTFCFNVDELQQYIIQNTTPESTSCDMFMYEELNDIMMQENVQGVTIPKKMSEEFRCVVENFAFIEVGTKPVQEIDRLQTMVVSALSKFVETTLASNTNPYSRFNPVGGFYHYTKEAFKKLTLFGAKLTIWLLEHPWYLMMATAVAKAVRLMICLYMSLDEVGVQAALQVFDKLIDSMFGKMNEWSNAFVRVLRVGIECFLGGISMSFASLSSCIAKSATATASAAQSFLGPFFTTFSNLFGSVMGTLDSINLAETITIAKADPQHIMYALSFQSSEAAQIAATSATIRSVVQRFAKLGDWEVMLLLYVMSKIDYEKVWNFMCFIFPAMQPFHDQYKNYNPLHILAKLTQYTSTVNAVWEAIWEIKEWVFDLGRCIWNILVTKLATFFGYVSEIPLGPAAITCCMTDLVVLLQKSIVDNSVMKTRENLERFNLEGKGGVHIGTGDVYAKVHSGKTTVFDQLAEGAAKGKALLSGGLEYLTSWTTTADFAAGTETMQAINDDFFTNLWALGNSTQSNLACQQPFASLETKDKIVPLHVFVTPYDEMYPNAPRVFIMVPIDFIKQHYPKAVFKYFNRDFVLLKYLPRNVAQQLVSCKAPIFNASDICQL